MLRILLDQETFEGEVWRSPSNQIGFLKQDVYDLPLEWKVSDYLQTPTDEKSLVMTMFIQLGFQRKQWEQAMNKLSMGERIKLKLLKQIITGQTVLVLDEPTNHLDIPTREELEKVLSAYQGTIIFVSHDRHFREKIMTRELMIRDQKIEEKTQIAQPKKAADVMTLQFQKDRLLSLLSVNHPDSAEYQQADKELQVILTQIKNL